MTSCAAPAAHPVHELIAARWSPRAFADEPVPAEQLASLFEAARWAASCFNEQPWHFIVARRDAEPEGFARLLGLLTPGNQSWARRAGALVITAVHTRFAVDGSPNATALYDLGQAVAQMALQAVAMGLVMHQMRGFDVERARAELGIPEHHEPVSAIAIGHLGNPSVLTEKQAEREKAPRVRKPQGEFVHIGTW